MHYAGAHTYIGRIVPAKQWQPAWLAALSEQWGRIINSNRKRSSNGSRGESDVDVPAEAIDTDHMPVYGSKTQAAHVVVVGGTGASTTHGSLAANDSTFHMAPGGMGGSSSRSGGVAAATHDSVSGLSDCSTIHMAGGVVSVGSRQDSVASTGMVPHSTSRRESSTDTFVTARALFAALSSSNKTSTRGFVSLAEEEEGIGPDNDVRIGEGSQESSTLFLPPRLSAEMISRNTPSDTNPIAA